jgi:hypothetical protein
LPGLQIYHELKLEHQEGGIGRLYDDDDDVVVSFFSVQNFYLTERNENRILMFFLVVFLPLKTSYNPYVQHRHNQKDYA